MNEPAYADIKDEDLKSDLIALYHSIHVVECYGTGDIIDYFATLKELENRGYEVVPSINVLKKEGSQWKNN